MAVLNKAPYEVIQLLVEIGGSESLLLKNKFGQTPYQLAVVVGAQEDVMGALNPEKVSYLLKDRIDGRDYPTT